MEWPDWFLTAFNRNFWGFAHSILGGVAYVIFAFGLNFKNHISFICVAILALGYEVYQWGANDWQITEKLFLDSMGDIILALVIAGQLWLTQALQNKRFRL